MTNNDIFKTLVFALKLKRREIHAIFKGEVRSSEIDRWTRSAAQPDRFQSMRDDDLFLFINRYADYLRERFEQANEAQSTPKGYTPSVQLSGAGLVHLDHEIQRHGLGWTVKNLASDINGSLVGRDPTKPYRHLVTSDVAIAFTPEHYCVEYSKAA